MNGKAFHHSQSKVIMSESSRNTAAKTLKNPYRLQTVTFKLFLKRKKTKIRKKKKMRVAYLVALVMATEGRCSHNLQNDQHVC